MPRGARIDKQATALARKAKRFVDRRSFISTKGELRLYGRDMSLIRLGLYAYHRGQCTRCHKTTILDAPLWNPDRAEVHHVKPRGCGGSDDAENLTLLCARCHRGKGGIHA